MFLFELFLSSSAVVDSSSSLIIDSRFSRDNWLSCEVGLLRGEWNEVKKLTFQLTWLTSKVFISLDSIRFRQLMPNFGFSQFLRYVNRNLTRAWRTFALECETDSREREKCVTSVRFQIGTRQPYEAETRGSTAKHANETVRWGTESEVIMPERDDESSRNPSRFQAKNWLLFFFYSDLTKKFVYKMYLWCFCCVVGLL